MERGAILHHAGHYEESIAALLKASALIKQQDIISAADQAGSMVTGEWATEYKGEHAERLLVHTYLMMDFLLTGKPESALVEAKQALEIFDRYPKATARDHFTRALIAHCFEINGEINGAYIEYKKLAEQMADPSPIADKLVSIAEKLIEQETLEGEALEAAFDGKEIEPKPKSNSKGKGSKKSIKKAGKADG